MNFKTYSYLEGKHSALSPSSYIWMRKNDDEFRQAYLNSKAKEKGTKLHEIAKNLIEEGIKLPKSHKTLNMYVNDAIGYRMTPEVVLRYSDLAFGTADAIRFDKNFLRIHDLKTGVTPAHIEQLYGYAAYFCLNYNIKPTDIECELRIYQNDEVYIEKPEADVILPIMDRKIRFDKIMHDIEETEA